MKCHLFCNVWNKYKKVKERKVKERKLKERKVKERGGEWERQGKKLERRNENTVCFCWHTHTVLDSVICTWIESVCPNSVLTQLDPHVNHTLMDFYFFSLFSSATILHRFFALNKQPTSKVSVASLLTSCLADKKEVLAQLLNSRKFFRWMRKCLSQKERKR